MAHRKYADFSCASCARTIEDLPLDSTRCPVCGKKRGFKRLFNAVQVSTRGHRVGRFVDRRLGPAYDEKYKKESSAKDYEKAASAALDKSFELATPEQRAAAVAANGGQKPTQMKSHMVPATAAMGMIDPAARKDTRDMVWPMVNRRVIPQYQSR